MQLKRCMTYVGCGLAGAVFGTILCEVVVSALLEVTISRIFSILFGCILLVLGATVAWRVWKTEDQTKLLKILLACLAVTVLISGLWCFLLDTAFVPNVPSPIRVFMYMCLGTNLSFLMTFSAGEFGSMMSALCTRCPRIKVVSSQKQILACLIGSVVIGLAFGLIFGVFEVSQHDPLFVMQAMQFIAVPVGAAVGAITAIVIFYVRSSSHNYQLQLNADSGIQIESDEEGPDTL